MEGPARKAGIDQQLVDPVGAYANHPTHLQHGPSRKENREDLGELGNAQFIHLRASMFIS
jgi:hypothetical protein